MTNIYGVYVNDERIYFKISFSVPMYYLTHTQLFLLLLFVFRRKLHSFDIISQCDYYVRIYVSMFV